MMHVLYYAVYNRTALTLPYIPRRHASAVGIAFDTLWLCDLSWQAAFLDGINHTLILINGRHCVVMFDILLAESTYLDKTIFIWPYILHGYQYVGINVYVVHHAGRYQTAYVVYHVR